MTYARAVLWYAVLLALAFAAYMAFAGSSSGQELVLGVGVAIFSAAVSLLTWRAMGLSARIHAADVLQAVWIPWLLISGAWEIVTVLARDLLGKYAGSYFRAVRFEKRSDPRGVLREVLAVAYTTVAPNFIVVGIDDKQGWMLFHQIERSGVPKATKRLGASDG